MKILLLGPPASGKGTLGAMLSIYFSVPLISSGDLLRGIPKNSIWYPIVHEYMDVGNLVPESISGGLLKEVTAGVNYSNGYILDGWCRQLNDLKHFDPDPTFVLHLNISEELMQARTSTRRVCLQEGHTYNTVSRPPLREGVCDIDGSILTYRSDDNDKVLKGRIEIYKKLTLPVVEHYRKKGKLLEIDAEPLPQEVFNNAIDMIRLRTDLMV